MMMHEQTSGPQTTTVPQWRDALDKGNHVRLSRADYKRRMKVGEFTSKDLLLDPPDFALDVKIVDILQWIPGIKRSRAMKIMQGIIYMESMPLRRISPVTRMKLYQQVEHLRPTYSDIHQQEAA